MKNVALLLIVILGFTTVVFSQIIPEEIRMPNPFKDRHEKEKAIEFVDDSYYKYDTIINEVMHKAFVINKIDWDFKCYDIEIRFTEHGTNKLVKNYRPRFVEKQFTVFDKINNKTLCSTPFKTKEKPVFKISKDGNTIVAIMKTKKYLQPIVAEYKNGKWVSTLHENLQKEYIYMDDFKFSPQSKDIFISVRYLGKKKIIKYNYGIRESVIFDNPFKNSNYILSNCGKYFKQDNKIYSVERKKIIEVTTEQMEFWKPKLTLNANHTNAIKWVDFSPDGKYFVTCGDEKVKVWDSFYGRELFTLTGHKGKIKQCVFSLDGKQILTASNKDLFLWDFETRQIKEREPFGDYYHVNSLEYSSNGEFILVEALDVRFFEKDLPFASKVNDYDFATKFEPAKGIGRVQCAHFHPDNKSIFSVYPDRIIRQYSFPEAKLLKTFEETGTEFSILNKGKYLIYAKGSELTVLDIEKNNIVKTINVNKINGGLNFDKNRNCQIQEIRTSSDGRYFATISSNIIDLWDAESFQLIWEKTIQNGHIHDLKFSPDNKRIIAVGDNANIWLWDLKTGNLIYTLGRTINKISSIDYSKERNQLLVSPYSNLFKLWDLGNGKTIKTYRGHNDTINFEKVEFIKGSNTIISASSEGCKIWDIEKGIVLKSFNEAANDFVEIENGTKLVTVGGNKINIYDLKTEKKLKTITLTGYWFSSFDILKSIAANPQYPNYVVVGGTRGAVMLVDLDKEKVIHSFKNGLDELEFKNVYCLELGPDGKIVCSGEPLYTEVSIPIYDIKDKKRKWWYTSYIDVIFDLDFSPNGKYLAAAGNNDKIMVWDTETRKAKQILHGHGTDVLAVSFIADGKLLVTGGKDGTYKFWDVQKAELLATKIDDMSSNEYVIYTPDGYYYTTKKGTDLIHFVDHNGFYSFDQFDLQYNRPDIVLERLGFVSQKQVSVLKKAYEKRVKKMGFNPEDFLRKMEFNAPEIDITSEIEPFKTLETPQLKINYKANDKLYLLSRLKISVNGVPVYGAKGKDLGKQKLRSITSSIDLNLNKGVNRIDIKVVNNKGVESLSKKIDVIYKPINEFKPNLYIISIGVSNFMQNEYDLTYASKDAQDILNQLEGSTGFANIYKYSFLNQNATKENILKIKEKLKNSKVDDMVLVFFASHGLLDDKMDYYLATHDVDFYNPSLRGLLYDDLEGVLDGIPARKKLLIIDACHSGEVDKDEMILADANMQNGVVKSRGFKAVKKKEEKIGIKSSFELMKEMFTDLSKGTGAAVISSAGGAEFAFESSEWKNGVFTYAVLEGLKTGNADKDKNGEIVVSELRDYVFDRVKELTNGQQNPTSRRENLEFDFRVW